MVVIHCSPLTRTLRPIQSDRMTQELHATLAFWTCVTLLSVAVDKIPVFYSVGSVLGEGLRWC